MTHASPEILVLSPPAGGADNGRGLAPPSTTTLDGHLVIRAAIVKHRTQPRDIDPLVEAVLARAENASPAFKP